MIGEVVTEVVVEGASELAAQVGFEVAAEAGTEALAGDAPERSTKRALIKVAVSVFLAGSIITIACRYYTGEWPWQATL